MMAEWGETVSEEDEQVVFFILHAQQSRLLIDC